TIMGTRFPIVSESAVGSNPQYSRLGAHRCSRSAPSSVHWYINPRAFNSLRTSVLIGAKNSGAPINEETRPSRNVFRSCSLSLSERVGGGLLPLQVFLLLLCLQPGSCRGAARPSASANSICFHDLTTPDHCGETSLQSTIRCADDSVVTVFATAAKGS